MVEITFADQFDMTHKERARNTVQGLLDAPAFGVVRGTMNQGGLRGHNFTSYARKAFREAMLTIIGFKYSGSVDFEFADNTLQRVTIY